MSSSAGTVSASNAKLTLGSSTLPVGQLESLRSRTNQIIESIQSLQRLIDAGGQNVMPAWPDILSKYNILLSQSHSIMTALLAAHQSSGAHGVGHPFEKLVLHPTMGMADAQLDNELIPLLRNQQTTDVLRMENEVVRHLSEHMQTKGSLGVLTQAGRLDQTTRTEHEDVLRECEQIRVEHDQQVERAVRAVAMLREKYDWKARVAVDQEEPEELEWDPRLRGEVLTETQTNAAPEELSEGENGDTPNAQSNSSDDDEELEEVLGNGVYQTPDGTPGGPGPATPVLEG